MNCPRCNNRYTDQRGQKSVGQTVPQSITRSVHSGTDNANKYSGRPGGNLIPKRFAHLNMVYRTRLCHRCSTKTFTLELTENDINNMIRNGNWDTTDRRVQVNVRPTPNN